MIPIALTMCSRVLAQFQPKLDAVALRVAGQEIKPVNIIRNWPATHSIDSRSFNVDGPTVTEIDSNTGRDLWSVKSPDGMPLRWLGAFGERAYFSDAAPSAGERAKGDGLAPTVYRLDLKRRQWLAPLAIPANSGPPLRDHKLGDAIVQLIADMKGIAVLAYATDSVSERHSTLYSATGYRVSYFLGDSDKPKWSKAFKWTGESPSWWGAYPRDEKDFGESSSFRYLNWFGDGLDQRILVCAGRNQELICLQCADGDEAWRVERIWEYERNYVGPSVFEFSITRFGLDEWTLSAANSTPEKGDDAAAKEQQTAHEAAKKELETTKQDFDRSYTASIIAGPIVTVDQDGGHHAFVAVSKGRKADFPEQVADCSTYELDDNGQINATTRLPQMVVGGPSASLPGSVLWTCDRGSLVRIGGLRPDFSRGFMHGFGTDGALCHVEWYREIPVRASDISFSSDGEPEVGCFAENLLLRTTVGGYVHRNDQHMLRFPITAIKLSDGSNRQLTVHLPFEGTIPQPKSGYFSAPGYLHAERSYPIAITSLTVNRDRLRVVIGKDPTDKGTAYDFALGAFFKEMTHEQPPTED